MLQVKDGIKYRFYIQMMPLVNNVSQPQHIDINISDQITKVFFLALSCPASPFCGYVSIRVALLHMFIELNPPSIQYAKKRSSKLD